MKLIIAEKPSLAQKVISAITEEFITEDGYYESNSYIVSFAFGHLFGLLEMNDYTKSDDRSWSLKDLPFFPEHFQFALKKDKKGKTDPGIKKQFKILCELMNMDDISEIIHCGDADREGEVIIRLIIQNGLKDKSKRITRLWLPDQTADTIQKGLKNLKPDSEFDNLYKEGLARTYIDWLFGINYTRYLSIKANHLLRTGRVITAIVYIIYQREMQIKNFVPQKFLYIQSKEKTNSTEIVLELKNTQFSPEDIEKVKEKCMYLNSTDAIVKNIEKKRAEKRPGKLFSLSKLQGLAGKKYKLSPAQTLSCVQHLYDNNLVTYPRTNTEYLAENEKESFKQLIKKFKIDGYNLEFYDTKRIFDSSKVESHSAITPLVLDYSDVNLSEDDKNIFELIKNRFLANFASEKCLVDNSVMTIAVDDNEFKIKGSVLISPGWMKFEDTESKDKLLPNLNIGDKVNINFQPTEGTTTPPNRFTTASLNNYCINPFKKENQTEDEAYKLLLAGVEIGTEATRASIIDNAINNKYIELKNNNYYLLGLGEYMINASLELGICLTKEKSVTLSMFLKKVYNNEVTISDAVNKTKSEIFNAFSKREISISPIPNDLLATDKINLGKCPKCGHDIFESKLSYSCSNYKNGCKFSLFKDNKFFQSLGIKTITRTMAASLITKKKYTGKFTSKKGKKYSATITVDFSEEYPKFDIVFPKKRKRE